MEILTNKQENRLMLATLFAFFVSGASSVLLAVIVLSIRSSSESA